MESLREEQNYCIIWRLHVMKRGLSVTYDHNTESINGTSWHQKAIIGFWSGYLQSMAIRSVWWENIYDGVPTNNNTQKLTLHKKELKQQLFNKYCNINFNVAKYMVYTVYRNNCAQELDLYCSMLGILIFSSIASLARGKKTIVWLPPWHINGWISQTYQPESIKEHHTLGDIV